MRVVDSHPESYLTHSTTIMLARASRSRSQCQSGGSEKRRGTQNCLCNLIRVLATSKHARCHKPSRKEPRAPSRIKLAYGCAKGDMYSRLGGDVLNITSEETQCIESLCDEIYPSMEHRLSVPAATTRRLSRRHCRRHCRRPPGTPACRVTSRPAHFTTTTRSRNQHFGCCWGI